MELQDLVLWHVEDLRKGWKPMLRLPFKCECLGRVWHEAPCPGDLQHVIDYFLTVARSFQEQGGRGIVLTGIEAGTDQRHIGCQVGGMQTCHGFAGRMWSLRLRPMAC